MKKTLKRDSEIFEYISNCIQKNGFSPSVRDIQNALNIKSTSTVHASISRLKEAGLIQKEQSKSRTLRLENTPKNEKARLALPILGRVAAGTPIFADENIEGYVDFSLPENEAKYATFFALRVKGESMVNAGIMDGDLLIVRKTNYAPNGAIVVAGVGDDATVKRFFRENGRYRLQPENDSMKPIIVDEAYIIGTVFASVRYY